MALTAFERFRFLWGAIDWQQGSDNPYSVAQTANLGSSAAPGSGVGVRRAVLLITRNTMHAAADPLQFHFDFLNRTGGVPDDTWTDTDYTTLEGYLDTFWTTMRNFVPSGCAYAQTSWYRVGSGISAPNPAERVVVKVSPIVGTGTATLHPPQCACSITFRTAVRRSWGRTYLPFLSPSLSASGVIPSGVVDQAATATQTLATSAASSDFSLVVISSHLNAALNVEKVEVDDNVDVIRRRRWKVSTYRKILP